MSAGVNSSEFIRGLAEEEADDQKDRAVADTGERRDAEIDERLLPARAAEKVALAFRREARVVEHEERDERGHPEKHDGRHQP